MGPWKSIIHGSPQRHSAMGKKKMGNHGQLLKKAGEAGDDQKQHQRASKDRGQL